MAKRYVCPSCGGLAPTARQECKLCGGSLDGRHRVPAPFNGRRWARCEFRRTCPACKEPHDVGLLELRGEVACPSCGKASRPDEAQLRDVLEICHAVVDPRSAALSQFAGLGREDTFIDYARDELSVRVSPGHPMCPRCAQPKEVDLLGRSRVGLRCPSCSEEHVYRADWVREANRDLFAWCHPLTEEAAAKPTGEGYREPAKREPAWLGFRGGSPRVARALDPPAPSSRAAAKSRRVRDRFRDPKWLSQTWPLVMQLLLGAVCVVLLAPVFLGIEACEHREQTRRAAWVAATCKVTGSRQVGSKRPETRYAVDVELPDGRRGVADMGRSEHAPSERWVVRASDPEKRETPRMNQPVPCFADPADPARAAFFRAKELAAWPLLAIAGALAAAVGLLWLAYKRV